MKEGCAFGDFRVRALDHSLLPAAPRAALLAAAVATGLVDFLNFGAGESSKSITSTSGIKLGGSTAPWAIESSSVITGGVGGGVKGDDGRKDS